MLSLSLLLVVISAVHRYTRSLIIPGVTVLMFLGAVVAVHPRISLDVEEFYGFVEGILLNHYLKNSKMSIRKREK